MASIPKIISNKTVLTGLANSSMKASSVFAPVSGKMDKMGKVVGVTPAFKKMNKIGKFTADSAAFAPHGPAGLGKPFFISKLPPSLCL